MSRFLIPTSETEARWLGWWRHLAPDPGEILGMSPFGDWFLAQADGQVWRLDLLEGSFAPLCRSRAAFVEGLGTDTADDEWLQAEHVLAMERRGHIRRAGECYTYRMPPRLGGPIAVENMALGPIGGWQLFMSQVHRQADAMPEGAEVTGIDCTRDGAIVVRWRPRR